MKLFAILLIVIAASARTATATDPEVNLHLDSEILEWAKKRLGKAPVMDGTMETLARENAVVRDLPVQSELDALFAAVALDKKRTRLVESFGFNAWYVVRHQLSPSFDIIIAGSGQKSKRAFNVSDIFVAPHREGEFGAPLYSRHRWKEITFAERKK